MKAARISYEVRVERHLTPATLATFPVALTATRVPRNRVHRLRVRGDEDLAEVVRRLTECQVELLQIRRLPPPGAPPRPAAPGTVEEFDHGTAELIAFPRAAPAPDSTDPQPAGRRASATVSVIGAVDPCGRRSGRRRTRGR